MSGNRSTLPDDPVTLRRTTNRMRIAFYCNWYIKQTIPLANALAERHDVLMIVPYVRGRSSTNDGCIGEDRLREMVDPRVSICTLNGMQGLTPLAAWALLRAAYTLIAFAPHVIHLHESYDFRSLIISLLTRKSATVLTVHDPVPHKGERITLRAFKHWVRDRTRASVDVMAVLSANLRGVLAD